MQTLRYKNVYLYRHDILRKIAETGFENDTLLVKNASITKVSPDFSLVRIKGELVFFSFRPEELEERKVANQEFTAQSDAQLENKKLDIEENKAVVEAQKDLLQAGISQEEIDLRTQMLGDRISNSNLV